jgi:Helix-turn-helix domain of resolvase
VHHLQLDSHMLDTCHQQVSAELLLISAIISQAIHDARGVGLHTHSPNTHDTIRAEATRWLLSGRELDTYSTLLGFEPVWFRQECLIKAGLSTQSSRLGSPRTATRAPKALRLHSPEPTLVHPKSTQGTHIWRESFAPTQRKSRPYMPAWVARGHVAEARRLHAQGISMSEIARRLHIARNTVKRCLKMADVHTHNQTGA